MSRLRLLAMLAVYHAVTGLVFVGHTVVLVLGAADAYVTAVLGTPRISYGCRRLAAVVRTTWKEGQR